MIRLGALGDVLRTLPAVAMIRALYPAADLAWLVEPRAAAAVRSHASVDDVLVFPRPRLASLVRAGRVGALARETQAFVAALRARRFDLVVDFHAILRSAVLARLSGAPQRVSYARPFAREGAARLATHRAALAPHTLSRFDRNAALAEYLGAKPVPRVGPWLQPCAGAARDVGAALGDVAPFVVLHPGSSAGTPYKRWPAERFGALAVELARDPGWPVLVAAGPDPGERALAEEVVATSAGAARLAPETPDLDALVALLAGSALFVGADSGPLHAASLAGTPVLQIMGPTHPVENEPFRGTPWRRARVTQPCSPCRRGCAAASCMTAIVPELVARAARELLATRAPGERA